MRKLVGSTADPHTVTIDAALVRYEHLIRVLVDADGTSTATMPEEYASGEADVGQGL